MGNRLVEKALPLFGTESFCMLRQFALARSVLGFPCRIWGLLPSSLCIGFCQAPLEGYSGHSGGKHKSVLEKHLARFNLTNIDLALV